MALLADTANIVRRTTGSSFSALATVRDGVPWNLNRLLSHWFPILLSIYSSPPPVWKPPLDEGEHVESNLLLQKVGGFVDGTGKEQPIGCHAQYAIVRRCNGSHRIAWKYSDS